jgi:hypothetical protein
MELSVFERLVLLNILPKEGNVVTVRIIHDLRNRLGFTEEELEKIQFTSNEKGTSWKQNVNAEIEIKGQALKIICEAFDKLSNDNLLTVEILPVYDRFMS